MRSPAWVRTLSKWLLRALIWALGILTILYCIAYCGMAIYATRYHNEALKMWSGMGRPLESVPALFPDARESANAKCLDELSPQLGVWLHWQTNKSKAETALEGETEKVIKQIGDYLNHVAEDPTDNIAQMPAELAKYLSNNSNALCELSNLLNNNRPIVWEQKISPITNAPFPHISGIINLHRLLFLACIEAWQSGNAIDSRQYLEASWRLNESLKCRPELLCQLIAIHASRMQLVLVRKMNYEPSLWQERLKKLEYKEAILNAYRYEAWMYNSMYDDNNRVKAIKDLQTLCECPPLFAELLIRSPLCRPDANIAISDLVAALAYGTITLQETGDCPFDKKDRKYDIGRKLLYLTPLWKSCGECDSCGYNIGDPWNRMILLRLESELTLRVLVINEMPSEKEACACASSPEMMASSCSELHWVCTVDTKAHTMNIELSKPIPLAKPAIKMRFKAPIRTNSHKMGV